MKKCYFIMIIFILIFANLSPAYSYSNEEIIVKVPQYNIKINDTLVDNLNNRYPMLVYNQITYFPMTWSNCNALGLSTEWDSDKGLKISKTNSSGNFQQDSSVKNELNKEYKAKIATYTIIVNGKTIENTNEEYPIINFRDITYFPLNWKYAVEEFKWKLDWNDSTGLRIQKDNIKNEVITWDDGVKYEGGTKEGIIHGYGIMTWPEGDKYQGEYKDGNREGWGTYYYVNGDKYEGEWKNDLRNGTGTYYYVNGEKYEGEWKNDLKNGTGTYNYVDGDKYEGEWKDDLRNGIGTYLYATGVNEYGVWENDYLIELINDENQDESHDNFNETIVNKDGSQYRGQIKDGLPHGYGTFTFNDGGKYTGDFKEGRFHGKGKLTYINGSYLEGTFEENRFLVGKGKIVFDTGTYEGEFKNAKYHGDGKLILENGTSFIGKFKEGVLENGKVIVKINNETYNISVVNGQMVNNTNLGTQDSNKLTTTNKKSGLYLIGYNDGKYKKYLGKLTTNKYDVDSVFNEYGNYGSKYSIDSIWNEYGTYGGKYSSESAFNEYATNPPKVYLNDKFIGYLTVNKYNTPVINPETLYKWLSDNGY